MRHSVVIEDFGIRLRPVQMEDSPFIVWLRNLEYTKGKIGDSATDIFAQEEWLEAYFMRDGDYYFIIESVRGIPLGTYGIYDVESGVAESGRWVVRPHVPAAIPSILLGFDLAFSRFQLRKLRAHTVSTNNRVLSLNNKLGFREIKTHKASQLIDGQPVNLIEFELQAKDWRNVCGNILPMAHLAEQGIRRWEQNAMVEGALI